jgi:hypothetical protein
MPKYWSRIELSPSAFDNRESATTRPRFGLLHREDETGVRRLRSQRLASLGGDIGRVPARRIDGGAGRSDGFVHRARSGVAGDRRADIGVRIDGPVVRLCRGNADAGDGRARKQYNGTDDLHDVTEIFVARLAIFTQDSQMITGSFQWISITYK